jgi:hypothetical protein
MDDLTQIGVGGIFAILVIREVLGFLKERKANGVSADARHSGTDSNHHRALADVLTTMVLPILENQTVILRDLTHGQQRLTELMIELKK